MQNDSIDITQKTLYSLCQYEGNHVFCINMKETTNFTIQFPNKVSMLYTQEVHRLPNKVTIQTISYQQNRSPNKPNFNYLLRQIRLWYNLQRAMEKNIIKTSKNRTNLIKAFMLLQIDLPSPTAETIVLKLSSDNTMSDDSFAT